MKEVSVLFRKRGYLESSGGPGGTATHESWVAPLCSPGELAHETLVLVSLELDVWAPRAS